MADKYRILIVDDDAKHALGTREILQMEGYEVFSHGNPFGTTQAVRDVMPDLVLLDINMPALSGEKLSSILKANEATRGVPIVFYSSNDEDSLRTSVSELGVVGYICKGDPVSLRRKVAYYLARARVAPR